jgi:RNA polymerase sigma-32 factor
MTNQALIKSPTTKTSLPVTSGDAALSSYIDKVSKLPYLSQEDEYMLAKRLADHQDLDAAHQLVTSHLRLVVKIAMGLRGYGLPLLEMISEGNIGLMQAVKKFNPEKGFRLSTYAIWWIRASIQEYILRSWSLVKIGTTASQKKLFFNLRKLKNRLHKLDNKSLSPSDIKSISAELDVPESDVREMDLRLSHADQSLNAPISEDDDNSGEMIDLIAAEGELHDTILAETQDMSRKRNVLALAMENLNERERAIISARRLSENPATLDDLSQSYGISRERVRQIENRAVEKMQEFAAAAG